MAAYVSPDQPPGTSLFYSAFAGPSQAYTQSQQPSQAQQQAGNYGQAGTQANYYGQAGQQAGLGQTGVASTGAYPANPALAGMPWAQGMWGGAPDVSSFPQVPGDYSVYGGMANPYESQQQQYENWASGRVAPAGTSAASWMENPTPYLYRGTVELGNDPSMWEYPEWANDPSVVQTQLARDPSGNNLMTLWSRNMLRGAPMQNIATGGAPLGEFLQSQDIQRDMGLIPYGDPTVLPTNITSPEDFEAWGGWGGQAFNPAVMDQYYGYQNKQLDTDYAAQLAELEALMAQLNEPVQIPDMPTEDYSTTRPQTSMWGPFGGF